MKSPKGGIVRGLNHSPKVSNFKEKGCEEATGVAKAGAFPLFSGTFGGVCPGVVARRLATYAPA